ncbi:MAG: hypothetical protein WD934_06930 [Gemmatimonadales bacterium]
MRVPLGPNTVVLTLAAALACSPFSPCTRDRIDAVFPVTVAIGDALQEWTLTGVVTETNIEPDLYQRLVAGLVLDTASAAGSVFTLDQGFGGDQAGFFAIWLRSDPALDAVLSVAGAFDGGGWGVLPGGTSGPLVALRIGPFQGTTATGTLTVLSTAPLRLDVDIMVTDANGAGYGFTGVAGLSRTIETITCS